MKYWISLGLLVSSLFHFVTLDASAAVRQWSPEKARAWYAAMPLPLGSNFVPADAVNQLEMWQAETFNLPRIDRELGWAKKLGMNSMRVFLHDIPWFTDRARYIRRIDAFLRVAEKHGIRPMFVLFDSVWDPSPRAGRQLAPRAGVHNSRWVQSPGLAAIEDPGSYPRLQSYVTGIIRTFGRDRRILAWDVWNEPDNLNPGSYDDPKSKVNHVERLLPLVFRWARAGNPTQPLTSGVWNGDWSSPEKVKLVERMQLELSDFTTFHNYGPAEDFALRVKHLRRYGRPIMNTEYMARPLGSTFETVLPVALAEKVGVYNWGFVSGKSQTYLPWDSWKSPYPSEGPPVWFHDIFFTNGKPYRQSEVDAIRRAADEIER